MRPADRESLRQRFQFRCGYCGVREQDVGAALTVDHFQPRSRGGTDDPDNLVYCCHACNEFKGDFWQAESIQRLLHPLRDDIAAHVTEQDDGTLEATSEIGAFHIERLHLNRGPLVAYRREHRLLQAARDSQARLLGRLQQLERQLQAMATQLELLGRDDPSRQSEDV